MVDPYKKTFVLCQAPHLFVTNTHFWTTTSNDVLHDLGLDHGKRATMCGHKRALSKTWGMTLGMWGGVCTPAEIMKKAGVERYTYDAFKNRHKLRAGSKRGRVPQWKLSLFCHHVVAEARGTMGDTWFSPGLAAHEHCQGQKGKAHRRLSPSVPFLGLLPAEIVIRHTQMEQALLWERITPSEYVSDKYTDEQRQELLEPFMEPLFDDIKNPSNPKESISLLTQEEETVSVLAESSEDVS